MSETTDSVRTLHVLLFSVLREVCESPGLDLDVVTPITGTRLLDELEAKWPALTPYRRFIRLAVNQEYVDGDARIHGDEEIALITPVSGG